MEAFFDGFLEPEDYPTASEQVVLVFRRNLEQVGRLEGSKSPEIAHLYPQGKMRRYGLEIGSAAELESSVIGADVPAPRRTFCVSESLETASSFHSVDCRREVRKAASNAEKRRNRTRVEKPDSG